MQGRWAGSSGSISANCSSVNSERGIFHLNRSNSNGNISPSHDKHLLHREVPQAFIGHTLIEEGETTPFNSDFKAFDISDDGSKIAYVHLNVPEIMVYDVATSTSTSILSSVPYTDFGVTNPRGIEPRRFDLAFFRMTGDGSGVYFLNEFGPNGGGLPMIRPDPDRRFIE